MLSHLHAGLSRNPICNDRVVFPVLSGKGQKKLALSVSPAGPCAIFGLRLTLYLGAQLLHTVLKFLLVGFDTSLAGSS
jgi:hypothetical protein